MKGLLEEPKVWVLRDLKQQFSRHASVADIGFGRGEFLEALAKQGGYILFGIESSDKMIEYSKRRLGGKALLQKEMVKETNIVTCFEVVEHLADPLPFLRSFPLAQRYYFSTPNRDRWWVRLTGKYEPWDYPPNHVTRYSRVSFKTLLEEAGFRGVRVYALPIKYHEILKPLYTGLSFKLGLQVNSENYDNVRNGRPGLSILVDLVRRLSWPLTRIVAEGLNRRGYVGGSLLAVCEGKR